MGTKQGIAQKMKRRYFVVLLAAAATMGAGTLAVVGTTPATTATVAKVATASISVPSITQRHTVADMMALGDGISYDDAARMLGTFGHVQVDKLAVDMGLSRGGAVAVYAWPNPDGSRVVLVFRDDRLIHRALVDQR